MTTEEIVYWDLCGPFAAAATARGLVYVSGDEDGAAELRAWADKRLPGARLVRDEEAMRPYRIGLEDYLSGKRRQAFDLPMDLRGTPFQLEVWRALGRIGYGETTTYAELAARLGRPSAARAVGAAVGANPLLIVLPCHRVVGSGGRLTGYRGGLALKERLLRLEGALAAGPTRS